VEILADENGKSWWKLIVAPAVGGLNSASRRISAVEMSADGGRNHVFRQLDGLSKNPDDIEAGAVRRLNWLKTQSDVRKSYSRLDGGFP